MTRLPRSVLPPEGIYHVTARGVDRCAIFRDDEDRTGFVDLLRLVCRVWRWRCHAYCLMDTHYHALVETRLEWLSAGCRHLNGTHARCFNTRHGRVGHLFGERFDARVLRSDAHLAAAVAYIRDNPVRAGARAEARDWPWSGARLDRQSSTMATARTGEPYAGSSRNGKP